MSAPAKKYDVAVLGWWYGKNYGSILTYYGLNRAIDQLGHSILMVHEPLGYNGYRVQWSDDILSMEFARRVGYEHTEQMHYSKLPELNDVARTFVVGSDQLWNPRIGRVNDDLFLDFVAPHNDRVAYATSFGNKGTDKFTPEFVAKHAANLQQFKSISVREAYAIDTAREVFGAKASIVVDPVFLMPREHYSTLADSASWHAEGEYLAVFFLDPTAEKRATALAVAEKLGYRKIVVIPNPDKGREDATELFADDPRVEVMPEDSPENFLRAYRDASYVVTDSFHGTAFATIFEKPFSSIYNTQRGVDRFKNLLDSLGFGDSRRVYPGAELESIVQNDDVSRDIDYSAARKYIEEGRASSLAWLKDALDPAKPASAALYEKQAFSLKAPAFAASNAAWTISRRPGRARLRVGRGGSDFGNLVWTTFPEPLAQGSGYELTITGRFKTAAPSLNVHLRNPQSGRFRVVGVIETPGNGWTEGPHTIRFRVTEPGFTQLMFGAIHFRGRGAGADIREVNIATIPPTAVSTQGSVKKKPVAGGFAAQSKALALNDHERQLRSVAHARSAEGVSGARARMIFHAHAIEKGLSRSDFRAGFGKIAVPGLAKEMNAWVTTGRDLDDPFFQSSCAVMQTYFQRHAALGADVSHFRELFSPESQTQIDNCTHQEGGVIAANLEREPVAKNEAERSFIDVMYGRRSVREFTSEPVRDDEIARAVQIAMQAPSVCNRQGARVHQFENPQIIKSVLDIQGGFNGYQMPPRLLLVTADLDAFLFAPERNQPFVDGGLFMMSLLLGLTQVGLGSCSLNTAMGIEKERKIRELIDIPDHEVFISFVAVGHYDEKVLVPRSKRTNIDHVLQLHRKA